MDMRQTPSTGYDQYRDMAEVRNDVKLRDLYLRENHSCWARRSHDAPARNVLPLSGQRVSYGNGRDESPRTNVSHHHGPFRTQSSCSWIRSPKALPDSISPVDDLLSSCKMHMNSREVDGVSTVICLWHGQPRSPPWEQQTVHGFSTIAIGV